MLTSRNEQGSQHSLYYCYISLKWIQKHNVPETNVDYCISFPSVYKKRFLQKSTVLAVVERLFWQLGTHFSGRFRCREVAVVERFKQELIYGLSAGTKKSGRFREVAVSGGSTVQNSYINFNVVSSH